MRRQLNLHIRPQRKLIHRHTSPDRLRVLIKEPLIHLIHSREILHVGEEDVNFDRVVNMRAGCLKDRREVLETLLLWLWLIPI